ncbi:hypothetical protein [Marinilabilia salmonicolor]|uniref:SpoIIAA-like protein n=1 Tax=Marinilabilia salmonicolor TaxID=989 RepID=A0A368VB50_9BACT|nr:hypothetical protein [Marinilabilia salmonicolor]RCW38342.1 hypothetical protein DFO77_104100 [Marinilabilia salmonicolor]
MITYHFNKDLNIVEAAYSGKILIQDLLEYGEKISGDPELPKGILRIFTDVSGAEYEIAQADYPKLVDALRFHVKDFKFVKAAFLQETPRQTALSMLFGNQVNIPNYYHKVFSYRDAAIQWLFCNCR